MLHDHQGIKTYLQFGFITSEGIVVQPDRKVQCILNRLNLRYKQQMRDLDTAESFKRKKKGWKRPTTKFDYTMNPEIKNILSYHITRCRSFTNVPENFPFSISEKLTSIDRQPKRRATSPES